MIPISMVTGKRIDSSSYKPLEIERPEQYDLILSLGSERGVALITSSSKETEGELLELEDVSIQSLSDRFSKYSKDFNAVSILFDEPIVTIVPEGLFDNHQSSSYLRSVFPFDVEDSTALHSRTLDGFWVFKADKEFEEGLLSLFPQAVMHHLCTPIIESLLRKSEMQDQHNQLHLHLSREHAFLFVFKGDSLTLFNSLKNKQATDLVYEAVFVLDRMGLDKQDTAFSYSGDTVYPSGIQDLLDRYLPEVSSLQPWSAHSADGWNKELLSKHLPVFDTTLCES